MFQIDITVGNFLQCKILHFKSCLSLSLVLFVVGEGAKWWLFGLSLEVKAKIKTWYVLSSFWTLSQQRKFKISTKQYTILLLSKAVPEPSMVHPKILSGGEMVWSFAIITMSMQSTGGHLLVFFVIVEGQMVQRGECNWSLTVKHTNVKLCDKVEYPFGDEFDTDILWISAVMSLLATKRRTHHKHTRSQGLHSLSRLSYYTIPLPFWWRFK